MDVLHLARHVFSGDEVSAASGALARASRLVGDDYPESLLRWISSAGLGAGAVDPCCCGAPARWNMPVATGDQGGAA